jgi:hypothetical protein
MTPYSRHSVRDRLACLPAAVRGQSAVRVFVAAVLLAGLASEAQAWEKKGTVYTTDGSPQDVKAAVADAKAGDTVRIPPGTFTYGANQDVLYIDKPITLAGSGRKTTTIVIADTSGVWTNAAIRLLGGPTVRDFSITGASVDKLAPFAAGGANGWRITNIKFNQVKASYFLYVQGCFGLVDNCTLNGAAGNSELIFTRGPADAWQTDNTIGTADSVYIEDCTINGSGYVCDINSNGKAVVRFCTITGPIKVDGHGKATNTPARGVRHMEVYRNTWTSTSQGGWLTVEMRGGTGHIFANTAAGGSFMLRDYAIYGSYANLGNRCWTPKDYPIDDQIGTGKDPKVGGSEPMYLWNNRMTNGEPWRRSNRKAGPEAIELNGGEDFYDSDLIAQNRDFFQQVEAFDGSSGMGTGTRAQMQAIKPTRTGVGFWVTDEGDWNARNPGPDGRLYTWNGTAWALKYTPYAYPHPLRAKDAPGAPASP